MDRVGRGKLNHTSHQCSVTFCLQYEGLGGGGGVWVGGWGGGGGVLSFSLVLPMSTTANSLHHGHIWIKKNNV